MPIEERPAIPASLKRRILVEAGYVNHIQMPGGVFIGGMRSNPDYLQITPLGREFIVSLSSEDIGY